MLDQNPQHILTNLEVLAPLIVTETLHVIAAILILVIGFWIAGKVQVLASRSLAKTPHFDPMLQVFFGHIARYFILTLVLLAVLAQFGIQTTSLVAVLS